MDNSPVATSLPPRPATATERSSKSRRLRSPVSLARPATADGANHDSADQHLLSPTWSTDSSLGFDSSLSSPSARKFRRRTRHADLYSGWTPKPPTRTSSMISIDSLAEGSIGHHQSSYHLVQHHQSYTPQPFNNNDDVDDDDGGGYMSASGSQVAQHGDAYRPSSSQLSPPQVQIQTCSEPLQDDIKIDSIPSQTDDLEAEHSQDQEAALAALEDLVNPDRAKSLFEARQRAQARRQRITSIMLLDPAQAVHHTAAAQTKAADEQHVDTVALQTLSLPPISKLPPSLTWSLSSISNSPLHTPTDSIRQHQPSLSLPGTTGYFPDTSSYHKSGVPIYGHNVPLPPCLLPGAVREPAKRSRRVAGMHSVSSPLNSAFGSPPSLSHPVLSTPGLRNASSLERSRSYARAYAEIRALDSGLQSIWMSRHNIDAWAKAAEIFADSEIGPQPPVDEDEERLPVPTPASGTEDGLQQQEQQQVQPSRGGLSWTPRTAVGGGQVREQSPYRASWSTRAKIFVDSAARPAAEGIPPPTPPPCESSVGNSESSDSASSVTDPSTADSTPHTSPVMTTFPLKETDAHEKHLPAEPKRQRTISSGGVQFGAGLTNILNRRASTLAAQHGGEEEQMETMASDLTPTQIHPGLPPRPASSSSRPSSRASQVRQMISLPFSTSQSSPSSPQASPRRFKGMNVSISGPRTMSSAQAAVAASSTPSSPTLSQQQSTSPSLVTSTSPVPGADGKKHRMRNLLRSRPSTADPLASVDGAALSSSSSSSSWFGGSKGRGLGLGLPASTTTSTLS